MSKSPHTLPLSYLFKAHSNISCPKCGHEEYGKVAASLCSINPLFSAVFFQDQSKRKETRMILFYVCVKCDCIFKDPTLEAEQHIDEDEQG